MFSSLVLVTVGVLASSGPLVGPTRNEMRVSGSVQLTTEVKVGQAFSPRATAKDPFRGLFAVPRLTGDKRTANREGEPVVGKPGYSVICGTVILKGNAEVDSRIRKPVPDGNAWYAIRLVPAPACR